MTLPADSPASPPSRRMATGLEALAGQLRRESWLHGWRGPLLAALIVLASALPGLSNLPPLDRDEARFAQSSAQMLETGDFVNIRYQDQPRDKKPIGINWLQALSVQLASSAERREIWAYRLPSLLGAMLAAASCVWGASVLLGPRRAFAAGAILGGSFLLSSEAFIAKTDAVLCGAVTLSMAALGRLYGASRGIGQAGRRAKALFWAGQALSILVKGPIGPMIAGLTLLTLWAADRRAGWMRGLGWSWGLLFVALVVGPWAMAVSVSTDASFWTSAITGDLTPKLAGGHQGHAAPPGSHLLISPLLLFPFCFLLPLAGAYAWRCRNEAAVRFALAWLLPTWVVFELAPTKLPHYPMPLYGALAWLSAGALTRSFGPGVRLPGAALSLLAGAVFAGVCYSLQTKYGGPASLGWAVLSAALAVLAAAAGALAAVPRWTTPALGAAGVLGIAAHGAITGGFAPGLSPLWTSQRAASLIKRANLDPRNGITPGPVAVAGDAEPSLVFALGTQTELDNGEQAADALTDGQPALVERRQLGAFLTALRTRQITAQHVGSLSGYDYSDHQDLDLTLWRVAPRTGAPKP